jgi:formamidopyrimidine-DNA glycosylase
MPELPDVELYVHALRERIAGQPLQRVRVASPFIIRTYDPPLTELEGREVVDVRRMGKRIVLAFAGDLFLIVHLMIAGRFRWREAGASVPGKVGLLAFDFPQGTLVMTEASSRRQASVHVVRGAAAVAGHDPGGAEIFDLDLPAFAERLVAGNHTLKRALTDPHIFSGIGNAYSDEVLHAARLSPLKLASSLSEAEVEKLYFAARDTLQQWTTKLRTETGDAFPEKVTAFRDDMAVHGKYGQPCPACGEPVQRIVYASSEANYCARCQTDGRLLSDRALSRLLGKDWPRTLEDMEARRGRR